MEQVEGVARACCVFDEEKKKILGFYEGVRRETGGKEKDRGEASAIYAAKSFLPYRENAAHKKWKD